MINTLILFVAGALITAGLDVIWIGNLFAGLYKRELAGIGRITGGEFKPHPIGIIVYFLMSLGTLLFVLPKAATYGQAALYGALFGLIIGGVYDLTNYSMLAQWSARVVIVNMCWVIISCTLTSFTLFALRNLL